MIREGMGVDGIQVMSRLGKSCGLVIWIFTHCFQFPGSSLPRMWRAGEKMVRLLWQRCGCQSFFSWMSLQIKKEAILGNHSI